MPRRTALPLARLARPAALALAATLAATAASAQQAGLSDEERTARHFDAIRGDPPALVAFLREMPKGGDLHSHLSGAVYAERFLEWAAEDGLCVDRRALAILGTSCTPGGDTIAAARAVADATLYGQLVDAMSMRNWHPARINGHDQFFATFARLGSTDRRAGDMVADAARRAAHGRVSYLELMMTPDRRAARDLGRAAGWPAGDDFAEMRRRLMERGIADVARRAAARLDSVEARRDTVLGCGTARAEPGCQVTVRWLYQVSRANPPEQVFAQVLTGFLMAQAGGGTVGLNLVQPEDNPLAMSEYSRQMRMIGFLRREFPGVRVTLHAGELAPGLVPPEGLRFHVREAVEVAGASRIGHGVDVMHEDRPHELLRTMAERNVMVEINLTSNDVILGVRGADHPLRAYLEAGVPVALSTDDEGVARSEMTMEYLKGAREQGLGYVSLKTMARNSLQHAFVEGESLWADPRAFTPVAACAERESRRCHDFAGQSPKARLQIALERAFADFEARHAAAPVPQAASVP
jgi:adenosine deaminase